MTRSFKPSPPRGAGLFSESQPAPPPSVYVANIDGASRGNPGPASYAVVIRDPAGKVVLELAKRLGRETNNVAEYYALLAALDYSATQGMKALRIRSDSELLVRQMQGRYKVKSSDLKPLYERATKLARQLAYFVIEHVPREQNRDADALANVALDSGDTGNLEYRPEEKAKEKRHVLSSGPPAVRIRAKLVNGVFVPIEPCPLVEGTEVTLDIRIPPRR